MLDMPSAQRFIINNDATVTDKAAGLMWMIDETPLLTLRDALKYCTELGPAGRNSWALPNKYKL